MIISLFFPTYLNVSTFYLVTILYTNIKINSIAPNCYKVIETYLRVFLFNSFSLFIVRLEMISSFGVGRFIVPVFESHLDDVAVSRVKQFWLLPVFIFHSF